MHKTYLHDVVLFSDTLAVHIHDLSVMFDQLTEANLIYLAKCEFGKATVTYLGKVVG